LAENIIATHQKADAILSANVICHIPYMHSIYDGVKVLLKDDGVFIFEDPYLGEVIEKTSFDQIYDEHVFLFSALSVSHLASMHDLELIDVEYQITHGGSMRYTIAHKGVKNVSNNVVNLIDKEKKLGLDSSEAYSSFADDVDQIKDDLIKLLTTLKNEGKKVVAYGATSKSTTVVNYFGITPDLIECIYDTTPIKQNKFSPGMHIPVLPYEQFRESDPDYVLLFAWNHAVEIMKKEEDYMSNGKHWITYIPKVEIN
jgi:methylation protein EvaC